MSIDQIPAGGWVWFAMCLIALLELYNLVSSARKNYLEEKKRKEEPDATLQERMAAFEKYLGNDKRRLDDHEMQISDIRGGQKANCKGVQALLEHELHNGNAEEMQKASQEINDWLLNRK